MLDQSLQFLTPEESAEVDKALMTTPEKFLTRLTISTAKLLKAIAQDLETSVDALTPQQIIAWFEADAKRKQAEGVNASVLKWNPMELDDLANS
jgi:hypothetical protein